MPQAKRATCSLALPVGLLLAFALLACDADQPRVPRPVGAQRPAAPAPTAPAPTSSDMRALARQRPQRSDPAFERFAGSTFTVQQIMHTLVTTEMRDLRPVGSTSVVFRAELDAPFRAALKLATQTRPLGPASEAAAYRLARCLGLTTVPPVMLRSVAADSLERALDPRYRERWPGLQAQLVVDQAGYVEGAAIFWVEGLRELPIAQRLDRESALQSLRQGTRVDKAMQLMAAQLSDLAVFDLLLGNSDRWSGDNVQGDASGQWLYIRDHDLAFPTQLRPEVQARLAEQLERVERFSRALITRVRSLSSDDFEREWSEDLVLARRAAWLRERVLPGVLARRALLLERLRTLSDRYGEPAVLAFP